MNIGCSNQKCPFIVFIGKKCPFISLPGAAFNFSNKPNFLLFCKNIFTKSEPYELPYFDAHFRHVYGYYQAMFNSSKQLLF